LWNLINWPFPDAHRIFRAYPVNTQNSIPYTIEGIHEARGTPHMASLGLNRISTEFSPVLALKQGMMQELLTGGIRLLTAGRSAVSDRTHPTGEMQQ
jgi:hypothetical protein